jgi:hypothetical protein
VNSDVETVPAARKRKTKLPLEEDAANMVDVTKANMSTMPASKRPPSKTNFRNSHYHYHYHYWHPLFFLATILDYDFTQQRLFGWQPILTPYNVLPVLFILGLIFLPLGIVFLSASIGVQEQVMDYSKCQTLADGEEVVIPGSTAKYLKVGSGESALEFTLDAPMKAPIYIYYRLTNFYQNNRLYAKSYSGDQLRGAALPAAELGNCSPLIADPTTGKPYYPCGLIANSYFSDNFHSLQMIKDASGSSLSVPAPYAISSFGIAWPSDHENYKATSYTVNDVVPPPMWLKWRSDLIENGSYKTLPALEKDERFMNWMKVSGLPTFRKLYGRIDTTLPAGTYRVAINDNFDVLGYQGTKSFVISTTSWAGGKNDALGWGFIVVGGLLLGFGVTFLIMFMMNPRKVGDISYLSWYAENQGSALPGAPPQEPTPILSPFQAPQ